MSETYVIKKKEACKTSLWSGGSTTELYIYPESADYKEGNFQCRISSATVEAERSDFTSLPGVKRYLSIFSGHLDMIHGENQKVSLEPFQVDAFDGGVPTVSFGKVTDFNLMLKNGADGEMITAQLKPGEGIILEPKGKENLLAIYVVEGEITLGAKQVKKQEMLICKEWRENAEIENNGEEEAKMGICRVSVEE